MTGAKAAEDIAILPTLDVDQLTEFCPDFSISVVLRLTGSTELITELTICAFSVNVFIFVLISSA